MGFGYSDAIIATSSRTVRLRNSGRSAASLRSRPRDRFGRRHAEYLHRARVGFGKTEDHVDGGRLAGAVRAEQRHRFARRDLQIDAVNCAHRAVAFGQ